MKIRGAKNAKKYLMIQSIIDVYWQKSPKAIPYIEIHL